MRALLLAVLSLASASAFHVTPALRRLTSSPHPSPRHPPRLAAATEEQQLSSRLIELIEPTDRGVAASDELRTEIAGVIEALEASWRGTDPFAERMRPFLLRRCEVAYVGQNSSVKANAAGGKYRGRIGRFLFRTDALFQHVLGPDVAVNVIAFRLLGLFPGAAVLAGKWSRPTASELAKLSDSAPRPLSAGTVRVNFEPPRVAFGRSGGLISLQFGPTSNVTLDCTYLDDRLRICRGGSSGTPFVFRADTVADGAPLAAASQQYVQCLERRPWRKAPTAAALLACGVLSAVASDDEGA